MRSSGHVLRTNIAALCRDADVCVRMLTRAKVIQQAPLSLDGVCPRLLLCELQQAQNALERQVTHWHQNEDLQQCTDNRQVNQLVAGCCNRTKDP